MRVAGDTPLARQVVEIFNRRRTDEKDDQNYEIAIHDIPKLHGVDHDSHYGMGMEPSIIINLRVVASTVRTRSPRTRKTLQKDTKMMSDVNPLLGE